MKSIKLKPTKEECIQQLSFDIREGILRSFKRHKIKNEGSIYKVLGIGFKKFKKHIEEQFAFCHSRSVPSITPADVAHKPL